MSSFETFHHLRACEHHLRIASNRLTDIRRGNATLVEEAMVTSLAEQVRKAAELAFATLSAIMARQEEEEAAAGKVPPY